MTVTVENAAVIRYALEVSNQMLQIWPVGISLVQTRAEGHGQHDY